MNALVRVRLLAFVCRLWGLVGPLVMGPAAQAKEGVPPSFGDGGSECAQKHEAASGATLHHQSYLAVGDKTFTSYAPWFAGISIDRKSTRLNSSHT